MYQNTNQIHNLTNEQRKALAQCHFLGIRPPEILLGTIYAVLTPDDEIVLTPNVARDMGNLHDQGLAIDTATGALVLSLVSKVVGWPAVAIDVAPAFTPEQETRIREIIREEVIHALSVIRKALYG